MLKRGKPMKRSAFKRKPPKARKAERGGDPEYLAFVRTLPCARCHRRAPSHPHHETGGGRGKGQKAPDRRTMPMCFECHRAFHDITGPFDGFTFDMKRSWQDVAIQNTLWAWELVAPQQVKNASSTGEDAPATGELPDGD